MVIIGQWPYQHTLTLLQLRSQAKAGTYYFVDQDRIVSHKEGMSLRDRGYIVSDDTLIITGEEMHQYISLYNEQSFPPPIHPDVIPLIKEHTPEWIMEATSDIRDRAPALLINDQDERVMEDIGALWNDQLGTWIIDILHLKVLRDKRRMKYSGKIEMMQHPDGILVEIRGDVTPHINLLKEVGGSYNEDRDVWFVPMSAIDRISHIHS